jgi:hypothetical protein
LCHCKEPADYHAREVTDLSPKTTGVFAGVTFGKSYAFCAKHAAIGLADVLDGPTFVVVMKVNTASHA